MIEVVTAEPTVGPALVAAPYFEFVNEKKVVKLSGEDVVITRDFFVGLLMPLLEKIKFDANFYRAKYPDLAEAEARGIITDLREHYFLYGYFENRLPSSVVVDGAYYARQYPDVAVAILENRTPSAQVHFEQIGFREGRLPRPGWTFSDLMAA